MKKHSLLIGIGLLIVLFFVGNAAHIYRLHFVDQLSALLFDYPFSPAPQKKGGGQHLIFFFYVKKNKKKSVKEEGCWPWSRGRLGLLMDKLFDKYGVAVVGFDVVFAEKDESSGLKVLQKLGKDQLKDDAKYQATLEQIRPQLEYDNLFAGKIKNRNVVLGYYLTDKKGSISGMLPEPAFPTGWFKDRPITFTAFNGYGANLPELQKARQHQ